MRPRLCSCCGQPVEDHTLDVCPECEPLEVGIQMALVEGDLQWDPQYLPEGITVS